MFQVGDGAVGVTQQFALVRGGLGGKGEKRDGQGTCRGQLGK